MIMQTSKPMKNCSKQELMLLLNGQLEDQEKLVKLLEKVMKDKKEVDSSYLDGFNSATAIVRYFYHMEKRGAVINNFEKVWNRRAEAESTRFAGYEFSKLKIICEEESVNYDEFISYARKRHLEEKESAE